MPTSRVALVTLLILASACVGNTPATTGTPPSAQAQLRLELFVKDLDASIHFYRDIAGFTLDRQEKDYAVLRLGTVIFGLARSEGLAPKHYFNPELQTQRRGLGTEIVIEVSDLEQLRQQIHDKGWPLLSDIKKRSWGAVDFRLADPDGYYLRFSAASGETR